MIASRKVTYRTTWKLEQKEDPILYQVVKHHKGSHDDLQEALASLTERKSIDAFVKSKDRFVLKNSLLYRKSIQGPIKETIFQFVVPQTHRSAALDGCHQEAAHQGQKRSLCLMQEHFWRPGMARDLQTRIRKCGRCQKLQPLTCSGPGKLLHMDFTSIEETVPL